MKTLTNFLMVCAVLSILSTNAMAGGDDNGGAKDDGTIRVENDSDNYVMAVVVGDEAPNTVSEFLAQGAQFVQPGDSASFDVAGGSHTVTAIFIEDDTFEVEGPYIEDVNVSKNGTTTVSGDENGLD